MSRRSKRERRRQQEEARRASSAGPAPTGYLACVDPDTGQREWMAYWLPPGVTPEAIGLPTGRG